MVANEELQKALKMVNEQNIKIKELEKLEAEKDQRIEKLEANLKAFQENASVVSVMKVVETSDGRESSNAQIQMQQQQSKYQQQDPPSRPDTPTNMEDAETQYDEEDLKLASKKKKKKSRQKATPQDEKRWRSWQIG